MSKITKISVQKNTDGLNIYLDGVFAFGIKQELLQDYDLHVGRELTERDIAQINKDDELKRCLDKAYRFLSYRPRSEQEVQKKLTEKFETKTVIQAIKKLKEFHYVDDLAFVNFWLEARGNTRGPLLLKNELRQKGIADDLIAKALAGTDAEKMVEDALTLVKSKRKYQNIPKEEAYKKIAPFLARRGYDYGIIKNVIKEL
jgi:regulatory protein